MESGVNDEILLGVISPERGDFFSTTFPIVAMLNAGTDDVCSWETWYLQQRPACDSKPSVALSTLFVRKHFESCSLERLLEDAERFRLDGRKTALLLRWKRS